MRRAGRGVPQPNCVVVTARERRLAIRAKGDGIDQILMAHRFAVCSTRRHLPELSGFVIARREERLAVGAEDDGVDPVLVSHGYADWHSGHSVPQPERLVPTNGS